jgi:hypothetical protein
MRVTRASATVAGILTLAASVAEAQAKPGSSTKQFKFKGAKVEAGMLYSYARSNLEGTKEGRVLVYVPDKKRVEILRLTPGQEGGQLVVGEMSWDTYSLKQFEIWREGKDGSRTRQATGSFSNDAFAMTVEDPALYRGAAGAATFVVPLTQVPVHLFEFDLVTLGLALRHFSDAKGSAEVGFLAHNPNVGPGSPNLVVSAGKASVAFVEEVDRDGVTCLKYSVTGPALGAQEGLLWLHKEKGYLQDAEVPVPSGADWPDLHITYQSAEKVAESDWPARRALEISKGLSK